MNVALPTMASRSEWTPRDNLDALGSQDGRAMRAPFQPILRALQADFGQPFSIVNTDSGELISAVANGLGYDVSDRTGLLAEVARRGKPEIVEDVSPLLMLALPLKQTGIGASHVAISISCYQSIESEAEMAAAAKTFGVDAERAFHWAQKQEVWPPNGLMRFANTTLKNYEQRGQISHLTHEINEAVAHARDTYVELGLLHRLARHLHISENESELWQHTLKWLADAIPAQSLAIVPNTKHERNSDSIAANPLAANVETNLIFHGELPLESDELEEFVLGLGPNLNQQPLVLNRTETSLPTWRYATVRELICVPIEEDGQPLGWILALNHTGDAKNILGEFGSVETRLLSSVGTILGIHSSNIRSYQQQAELFASSVQALTSAIDAKDRYTSGHSDRVARVAVHLAKKMGCDTEDLNTIYLAGLLHDIGKIGIDDDVLKKPGKLTPEEYEHIKLHPQLGYDILKGVRQLQKTLPVVLHHHEAWNGKGYPYGLAGTDSPLLARIVAVADSFDAMSSDRSYRKGLSDEKLDKILKDGAGSQWDADIINAFFEDRDEIRNIVERSQQELPLDVGQWGDEG